MSQRLAQQLNVLGLFALSAVLGVAFYDQFVNGSLPCPLCILQRAGFAAVGAGLALNVLRGPTPRGYGIMIIGAIAGGAVALRQIALHVVPGTGAYGPPFLGLHFYTWAFIVFAVIVLGCGLMLFLQREYGIAGRPGIFGTLAVLLFVLLVLGNGVSTLAECSTGLCPDDPVSYEGYEAFRAWLGR
ncbi:disulfide bond formation protein B [Acuticoccus sediminis]|uniref:Disulfide bond formation protein B n=1 Tax=Acuticoccus sediminis TaxID=2184697 RepID=A0A8B2NZW4_9HYPH|nr:disulfide bond formation protein B [Acuticoccus sediminis]RAI03426.1 disulfide bond formation protein B [Acuticoccus sediminis]